MKVLLYSLLFLSFGCMNFDYGHHFSFTNNTENEIDSLAITVGDETTMIYNSNYGMEESLAVPKEGYPHRVKIKTFTNGKTADLVADSFNCYNCDGSHEYILSKDSAHYVFHN